MNYTYQQFQYDATERQHKVHKQALINKKEQGNRTRRSRR